MTKVIIISGDECDQSYIVGPPGPVGPQGIQGPPGVSREIKAGVVLGSDFSGSPKKYSVVFDTPYADATYAIGISSTDARAFTYELKTQLGFVINANADATINSEVSWITTVQGET